MPSRLGALEWDGEVVAVADKNPLMNAEHRGTPEQKPI